MPNGATRLHPCVRRIGAATMGLLGGALCLAAILLPSDAGAVHGAECQTCHAPHVAASNPLIPGTVNGRVVLGNDRTLCFACHEGDVGEYAGKSVFLDTPHAKKTGFRGAALSSWPGRSDVGECINCHSPHGSAAAGFERASGNSLCVRCHDDASISRPANSSYVGQPAFNGSAHVDTKCSDCHAVHGASLDGAPTASLLRAAQDATCFRCHSASGDDIDTPGAKPHSWNNRDIAVEFARPSHHPLSSMATKWWSASATIPVMSQTRASEFDADDKFQMSVVSTYGAELAWGSYSSDLGVKRLLYVQNSTSTLWQQFDPELRSWGALAWNSWGYNPPDPAYNASSRGYPAVAVGGKIYMPQSAPGSRARGVYVPADGSVNGTWLANSDFPGPDYPSDGMDAAVDEGNGLVYYSTCYGGGNIYKYRYADNTWLSYITQRDAVTTWKINMQIGSSIAYSPAADRLFIIRRWGSSGGDGMLYYLDAPAGKSGNQGFTSTGVQVTRNDTTASWTHMARFTRGAVDYLALVGEDNTNSQELQVISSLGSSTPVRTKTGKPLSSVPLFAPVLEWDGGDYLYACNYRTDTTTRVLARIRIPADPVAGPWPDWEIMPAIPGSGTNASMTFADARPKPQTVVGYRQDGWIATETVAPTGATAWGTLDWSADVPAGTSITLKVQGWNGSTFVNLPGFDAITARSVDLSGIPVTSYPKLRVTASLASGTTSLTPRLTSWSITAVRALRHGGIDGTEPSVPNLRQWWSPATLLTTTVFTGSAQVNPRLLSVAQPTRRLFYVRQGGTSTRVDAYDPVAGAWNANGYNPADLPADPGPSSTMANFQELGNHRPTVLWPTSDGARLAGLDLMTGSWSAAATETLSVAAADSAWGGPTLRTAFMTSGTGSSLYRYASASGTWLSPVWMKPLWEDYLDFNGDSAIAYSPASNRLFMLARNNLYRLDDPANVGYSGTVTVTQVYAGLTRWDSPFSRMTRANVGGTDYIFLLGRTAWGRSLAVISALTGSSVNVQDVGKSPSPFSGPLVGMDLEWDGGDYLYWIEGALPGPSSGASGFARIRIPATPTNWMLWGDWETLPSPPGGYWGLGSSGCFADYTPYADVMGYATDTTTTSEILPAPGATAWGTASWEASTPVGTSVSVDVQTWTGSAWQGIAGYTGRVTGPVNLEALSTAAHPKLRMVVTLSTSDHTVAPSLTNWTVTSNTGVSFATSDEALPSPGDTRWGEASWQVIQPADTSAEFAVQSWDGTAWVDIPGYTGLTASPKGLGALSVSAYPKLRLRATMRHNVFGLVPLIGYWTISSGHDGVISVSSLACASCHDAHTVRTGTGLWDTSRVSDPVVKSTVWASGSTPDTTSLCLKCHSGSDLSASGVLFTATSAPFFPGWAKDGGTTSFTGSGHFMTTGTKALCQNCHDPHGSQNQRLAAWTAPGSWAGAAPGARDNTSNAAFEQNLCYQCHGNGTIGRAAPGAKDVASPASGAYAHPISSISGRHRDNETTIAVGAQFRHSECVDCHDPHAARPGLHVEGSSRAGAVLRGVVGVKPVYSPTAAPGDAAVSFQTVRMTGMTGDLEAYVCFKCHTAATILPTTGGTNGYGSTDVATEFNPANYSYHNVLGLPVGIRSSFSVLGQTTTWGRPGWQTFATGWNANSQMTCTSCHTGGSVAQAKGPHGSSVKFGLDPAYPGDWETAGLDFRLPSGVSENIICLKCHVFLDGGSNTAHGADGLGPNRHTKQWWSGATCISCHCRTPHGWKRPRLLGYTTDPAPYRSTYLKGVSIRSHNADFWVSTDCSAGCTSLSNHTNLAAGPFWP